jgi:hypothetical protein
LDCTVWRNSQRRGRSRSARTSVDPGANEVLPEEDPLPVRLREAAGDVVRASYATRRKRTYWARGRIAITRLADAAEVDVLEASERGGAMVSPIRASAKRRPSKAPPQAMATLTPENYRADPLFSRIERAVLAILSTSEAVAPVDVLVRMGALRARDLEEWRFGRVPFLERVIQGNLSKLRRILRILGFYCHDLNLGASSTAYVRWGKGQRTPLRFTKSGEPRLETIYARHFVWPGNGPFHLPTPRPECSPEVHQP